MPHSPPSNLKSHAGPAELYGPSPYSYPSYVPSLGTTQWEWGASLKGRQGCVEVVGFPLSTDSDVVLCRACQAFLVCWDAR